MYRSEYGFKFSICNLELTEIQSPQYTGFVFDRTNIENQSTAILDLNQKANERTILGYWASENNTDGR